MSGDESLRIVIPPRRGLAHLLDASRYSRDGFLRLMQETAARQELILLALAGGGLGWLGASTGQMLGLAALALMLLAVEALNTAIEVLTDRISPGWSVEAKAAKDLGSLAVALMVLVTAGYVVWVGIDLALMSRVG